LKNYIRGLKIRPTADDCNKQTLAALHPLIVLNSYRIVKLVYTKGVIHVKSKYRMNWGQLSSAQVISEQRKMLFWGAN